jgi:hypothetical protein
MRGLLIFLMPFITLLVVLANFGLLPGIVFRRYGRIKNNTPRAGRTRTIRFDEDERDREETHAWRSDSREESEIITLPETALHKERRSGEVRHNQGD